MITFLKGNIIELSPSHVVLDCHGTGYYLNISLYTFSRFENQKPKEVIFHTYLSIKEDSHTLYGFFDKQERECFCLLISVSGVGASTARMIMSSMNPSQLQSVILNEDVTALKSVKGIGLKSAQRIIIDLKDKMNIDTSIELGSVGLDSTTKQESLRALEKLGFSIKKMHPIIDKITRDNQDLSVEDVIKLALKKI